MVGISGVTIQSNTKFTVSIPAGASFNTASPTCTSQSVFVTISSCSYSASTLTINIGTVSTSLNSVNINVTNFVNPATALTYWPATGGFTVNYNASGGINLGTF